MLHASTPSSPCASPVSLRCPFPCHSPTPAAWALIKLHGLARRVSITKFACKIVACFKGRNKPRQRQHVWMGGEERLPARGPEHHGNLKRPPPPAQGGAAAVPGGQATHKIKNKPKAQHFQTLSYSRLQATRFGNGATRVGKINRRQFPNLVVLAIAGNGVWKWTSMPLQQPSP